MDRQIERFDFKIEAPRDISSNFETSTCVVLMLEENMIRRQLFRFKLPKNDDKQLLKLIRVPVCVHRYQVGLTSSHAYLLLALNA